MGEDSQVLAISYSWERKGRRQEGEEGREKERRREERK